MLFFELYDFAEQVETPAVPFDYLRRKIDAYHPTVGRVDVFAITYNPELGEAHYKLSIDRSSPYEEEFIVADILYCSSLDRVGYERRYALTKELMHVFDSEEEKVNSKEKFITLIREIQNKPMWEHATPMFKSELHTRWMAALILCPKNKRETYLADYKAGRLVDLELSQIFRVPEWVIPLVMSDYYDVAYNMFVLTPRSAKGAAVSV